MASRTAGVSPVGRTDAASETEHYDAIVLAGGTARRLGGADKPGLLVGGRTLLDAVLAAVPDASKTVVVGPERPTRRPVTWAREEPPGGGPVAALVAALPRVDAPTVVVLAGDLPFLEPTTVQGLRAELGRHDGAMLVDHKGRDQLLVGAWRTAALGAALTVSLQGGRLAAVLDGLDVVRIGATAGDCGFPPWFDCDTEEDIRMARESI